MEIPRHWRLKVHRYRLEGSFCFTCGQVIFPPRPVCPHYTARSAWIAANGLPAYPTLLPLSISNRRGDTTF